MKNIYDKLIENNLLKKIDFEEAKLKKIGVQKPLHDVLIEMGSLNEQDFLNFCAREFSLKIFNGTGADLDKELKNLLPFKKAKKYGALPLKLENNDLLMLMSNPFDLNALDYLREITSKNIQVSLISKSDLDRLMNDFYCADDSVYDLLKSYNNEISVGVVKDNQEIDSEIQNEILEDKESPASKLVNYILVSAVQSRATDIHIEPFEKNSIVRYRIDGVLIEIIKIPSVMHERIISRIKILTKLDIAETRKAQDGRCNIKIGEEIIDARISIIPMLNGEKTAIRLLRITDKNISLESLGYTKENLEQVKNQIKRNQGIALLVGPTGSGKTSTIYACLQYLNNASNNITTIEDPIEYSLEGINQLQLNKIKDVTFSNSLRNILRQDPDIIFVGEIRDLESAEMAFRSSLTGHLVFSTLHTNNAISTITRLLDLGLDSYLISDSLNLIISQRLIRLICNNCKEEYWPEKEMLKKSKKLLEEYKINTFFHGKGCEKCKFTGYYGRMPISEILTINQELKNLITGGEPTKRLLDQAQKDGFKTIAENAFKVLSLSLTTLDEISRVCDFMQNEDPESENIEMKLGPKEKTKVLFVDGEEDLRKVFEKRFKKEGFHVSLAENGEKAIECVYRLKPDLIIMDWMMPKLDGLNTIKRLRSSLETAKIPIIMLTAKGQTADEIEAFNAGADDYIRKPFDAEVLLARMNLLLKEK